MRYGSTARRVRSNNGSNNGGNNHSNRSGGNNGGNQQRRTFTNKNKVFDSNGPDVRIRGTAYQIIEKYLTLAKDSASAGDRVLAESYLQYAEHYQRIISSWEDEYAPDPFDPRYEETSAAYVQFLAMKASQPASFNDEDDESLGNEVSEQDDLGLPSSLIAAPKAIEIAQQSHELADA
jgi:Domain of unknown function (DUF4167)